VVLPATRRNAIGNVEMAAAGQAVRHDDQVRGDSWIGPFRRIADDNFWSLQSLDPPAVTVFAPNQSSGFWSIDGHEVFAVPVDALAAP